MQIVQPLPGTLYEVVASLAAAGTPGATMSTAGYTFVSAGGITFYPIDSAVTISEDASVSLRLTPSKFGDAGKVAVGALLAIYLTGIATGGSFTVASCEPSPYTAYARHLAKVLGTAVQAVDGSMIAEDLRTLGKGLYDADATLQRAIDQAFPDAVTDLLAEWEARLGLPIDTTRTPQARQLNVLAKYRAAIGSSAERIDAAIQTIDSGAKIVEWTIDQIRANEPDASLWVDHNGLPGTERLVFRFNLSVSQTTYSDAVTKARVEALVEQMKSTHTTYVTCVKASGFKFDDPSSLFDRDVFGG